MPLNDDDGPEYMLTRRRFLAGTASVGYLSLLGCGALVQTANEDRAQDPEVAVWKSRFLELCDLACQELDKEITPFLWTYIQSGGDPTTHHMPFFEDSYAIRALCVAYDMTSNRKYLDTCQYWADRVIALQNRMIPEGAYYLNYGRGPGADQGDWYVADGGTIGMGVLATSVRTLDDTKKALYMNSVKSFAKLVAKNFVGKNGGITDGIWSLYGGEWWCSTAVAGALFFLLNAETASGEYLEVALRAFDWTLLHGLRNTVYPTFEEGAPGIVFYTGEFYAAALNQLAVREIRREAANVHIATILEWLSKNQKGRGATNSVDYFKSTYMAGMPYLMTAFAREFAGAPPTLRSAADEELRYVKGILFKDGPPKATQVITWELMTWAMMSHAEKLNPGALFRNSNNSRDIPRGRETGKDDQ